MTEQARYERAAADRDKVIDYNALYAKVSKAAVRLGAYRAPTERPASGRRPGGLHEAAQGPGKRLRPAKGGARAGALGAGAQAVW